MKKMHFLWISALILLNSLAFAQPTDRTYGTAAESDPEAKAILEKMRKKYDSYKTLAADIVLTISIPDQPEEVQKGSITQSGDKYRMILDQYAIICDADAIWFYQSDVNEVQINSAADMEEDEDIMTPNKLLRIYESDDFAYAIGNSYTQDGQPLQEIEFKPLDRDSEYAKMRLILNTRTYHPTTIRVFSKDGSRYELQISEIVTNRNYEDKLFSFSKEDYPGVHVEDLRID